MTRSLERRLADLERRELAGEEPVTVTLLQSEAGVPWWRGEVVEEFASVDEFRAWVRGEGDESPQED